MFTQSLNQAGQVATQQGSFEVFLNNMYTSYTNPTYSNAFSSNGTSYVDVSS